MNQRGGSFFVSDIDIWHDHKREIVVSFRHEEDPFNIWDVSLRLVLEEPMQAPAQGKGHG